MWWTRREMCIRDSMFPDKIAKGTLDFLESVCKTHPHTDGTSEGLKASTEEAGIDISVAPPIVTKLSQFASINRFASGFQEGRILSFGISFFYL